MTKLIVYLTLALLLALVIASNWSGGESITATLWRWSGGGWVGGAVITVVVALLLWTIYILFLGKR